MNQEYLFPFQEIRESQEKLIEDIKSAIDNKKHALIHAPTGLGKTISTLGPALKLALEKNLTVIFVTPKHTQHRIAVETLKDIKNKFDIDFTAVDFVGKKWMCAHEKVESLSSGEFHEFCNHLVKEGKCPYYKSTKKNEGAITVEAEALISKLLPITPMNCEDLVADVRVEKLCPYEVTAVMAKNAQVIIADYFHILHPGIREKFLRKTENELGKCILIIDEGHNLPDKVRDLMSVNLSSFVLSAAIKEAENFEYAETKVNIEKIRDAVEGLAVSEEAVLPKVKLKNAIEQAVGVNYDQLVADLDFIGDDILVEKKRSFISSLATFLQEWLGEDFGFTRIIKRDDKSIIISYRCLDPSFVTRDMINESYSTIVMSGTLQPLDMYKDILGFPEETIANEYKSPFKNENRLSMIIPMTTTKYSERSEKQFQQIAEILSEIANEVPGNTAVFFPSYFIRDKVNSFFQTKCLKSIFLEQPGLSKADKNDFLNRFKSYKDSGAVLLGAVSGSFSEGVDFIGDLLKCVVVVGIPLGRPDLETNSLIKYYDQKFGKGWDYGYSLPAMSRVLQGAGRCIRSETDRGVIAFLDSRFTWNNYFKCFPKDWDIKITGLYTDRINEFFKG